jgi:formylglycine-generating enzyme required for sulfatase activity
MTCLARLGRLLPALAPLACLALALPPAGRADRPKGKKYALLVGIKEYEDKKLKNLDYTENDAVELAAVLRTGGYEVVLLTSGAGKEDRDQKPTAANIRARLKALLGKATKHDTVLVGLAGHGVQLEVKGPRDKTRGKPEAFFCPSDGNIADPKTLISVKGLFQQLDDSKAGLGLLLVDACRDNPRSSRNVDVDNLPRAPKGTGALFSCASGERAYETDKLGKGHGVFFHYVLQGLKGAAKNKRGEVTWDRLTEYVKEKVSDEVPTLIGHGAKQSPHKIENLVGKSPVLLKAGGERKLEPARGFTNTLKMQFKLIPRGTFLMGSPRREKGRRTNEQQHQVQISKPFYMAVHPVTVGQFRRFVAASKYRTEAEKDHRGGWGYNARAGKWKTYARGHTWRNPGWKPADDHPVVNVTWNDAVAFCEWLSEKEEKKYRLPTEAQWEYACRAGTKTRFWCGDDDEDLKGKANIADLSLKRKLDEDFTKGWTFATWDDRYPFTAPVGSFKENGWGLYDMHGNVRQWCLDRYRENYQDDVERDPKGPRRGATHVLRGGSWFTRPSFSRAAVRVDERPDVRDGNVGFRVICVVPRGR